MIEKMLKFVMMVAIFLILFSVLKIITMLTSINNNIIEEKAILSEIQYNLSWLSIDAVILESNE
jgi:cell division protein FtsL